MEARNIDQIPVLGKIEKKEVRAEDSEKPDLLRAYKEKLVLEGLLPEEVLNEKDS